MDGHPVIAAVSSQFVVDPRGRAELHGVTLLREFLSGPQDLSIADEANSITRALWEALGGTTALLYSMHWTRALRPCRLALSFVRRRPRLAPLAAAAGPIATMVDELAARLPRSPLRPSPPRLRGDVVSAEDYLEHLPRFTGRYALRPEYRDRAAARALMSYCVDRGAQRVLLRDGKGQPRGVYLYSPGDGGIGQVIQIAGDAAALGDVLQHLFHDAWTRGALALSGRLDPALLQALSDGYALFHRRGPWMLIHARRPELAAAFERGKAFFSALEGELCLRFDADRAQRDHRAHNATA
jgi:hypothetical protein